MPTSADAASRIDCVTSAMTTASASEGHSRKSVSTRCAAILRRIVQQAWMTPGTSAKAQMR
eukprot:309480-Prorocentrum_lima.AAC.1